MVKALFAIRGTLLSLLDGSGLRDLRIEAWDKGHRIASSLGVATTDDRGHFEIQFDPSYDREICEERKPDVYFRVLSGDRLIESTENSVLWNVEQCPLQVTISVDLLPGRKRSRKRPTNFTVRGRVSKPDGSPPRLRIVALEKDPNSTETQEDGFRMTKTDTAGLYAIHYSADQLRNPAKGSADPSFGPTLKGRGTARLVATHSERARRGNRQPGGWRTAISRARRDDVVAQRVGPFLTARARPAYRTRTWSISAARRVLLRNRSSSRRVTNSE
jgi:hypothetical protein